MIRWERDGAVGFMRVARGQEYALRAGAIAVSAALLTLEGVSSLGLALPTTGFGAVRMAFDAALALGLALLATTQAPAPRAIAPPSPRLRPLALAFTAALALLTLLALFNVARLILFTAPAQFFVTDVMAFSDECARLTLAGHNPYTSASGFTEALQRFPQVIPTPLRGSIFGPGPDAPSRSLVAAVERRYLAHPESTAGAFDARTLTSYPALSFLLYLPLVWLGAPDILLLNLLVFAAIALWVVMWAPRDARWWVALALSAALPLLVISLIADTEVVSLAFILIAWSARERRWVSVVALGLGCAFRQYCWIFAPFFLLDVLLHAGWREALKRGVGALVIFLAINLPFIIANPGAWWTSVWLPLTEPLFPQGVGLVALLSGHVAPYPAGFATLLEVLALLCCLWAQWRWRERLSDAFPLLALIPLYFAWRSLPNYFAIAPLLALFAIVTQARLRDAAHRLSLQRA